MNEKLLALYLERLLARLYTEINEADEALGSDVSRVKLPTIANSEFENSIKIALGARPTEAIENPPCEAIALVGLRIFAESIREDISTLSGSEGLRIDPSVYFDPIRGGKMEGE